MYTGMYGYSSILAKPADINVWRTRFYSVFFAALQELSA